jgi:hypothetical protein
VSDEGHELPIFVLWERLTLELLERTTRFPKAVRLSLTTRIESAALDVLEGLATVRFDTGPTKAVRLVELDRHLTRLRVLLRLAHARRYLDTGGYEHVSRQLDEAGRMLGGWRKQAAGA